MAYKMANPPMKRQPREKLTMLIRKYGTVLKLLSKITSLCSTVLLHFTVFHQAFEPVLVGVVPLNTPLYVQHQRCFDGDQMAVHVPLSHEARVKHVTLCLFQTTCLNLRWSFRNRSHSGHGFGFILSYDGKSRR